MSKAYHNTYYAKKYCSILVISHNTIKLHQMVRQFWLTISTWVALKCWEQPCVCLMLVSGCEQRYHCCKGTLLALQCQSNCNTVCQAGMSEGGGSCRKVLQQAESHPGLSCHSWSLLLSRGCLVPQLAESFVALLPCGSFLVD